jgi:hypothetical protein
MTRARRRLILFALVPVLAAAALIIGGRAELGSRPPVAAANRPTLLLLTSLPLLFGEDFSISSGGSPVLKLLQPRYRLVPICVTDRTELAKGRLLLMAQPQAQTPENLVALDAWVRGGGRLLLLADPMLEWPSKLPLGDPTRPPPMFVDTGLLGHWGLRLDAPDQRGAAKRALGGFDVITVSPGALHGSCQVSSDHLVSHCRIGRGEVTVIADADFLDVDQLGREARHNFDAFLAELATLGDS